MKPFLKNLLKAGQKSTGRLARRFARKTGEVVSTFAKEGCEVVKKKIEATSDKNWYRRGAESCEDVSDAMLREDSGVSRKISKGVIAKLGAAGTSVGIFGIASVFGAASTGTAIGSLSGAAFSSAALAWVGGSMFMGSVIIGVASIAGGFGALLGAGWVFKKYVFGKKRKKSELNEKEAQILDACLGLSASFRQLEQEGRALDSISAAYLQREALGPLSERIEEYKAQIEKDTEDAWPLAARRRFTKAVKSLKKVSAFIRRWSESQPKVSIGIVSAVLLKLSSEADQLFFSTDEQLVLDALRRSNNDLTHAEIDDLSEYVKGMSPERSMGLRNNVKGIYHELKFAHNENTDGDEYYVELFEATNHPGADVKIINRMTGKIEEYQLKATDYLSYVEKHNERYADIPVIATSEVAGMSDGIGSTGISNQELNENIDDTFGDLKDRGGPAIVSSMTTAAIISLAFNTGLLLKGRKMTKEQKSQILKSSMVSAGVAGVVSLLIG